MATWRVNVVAPDVPKAKSFKDDRENFKKFYGENGTKLTFEFPLSDEKGADAMVEKAKSQGLKAEKERYEDPLDSTDATADFW